MHRPDLVLAFNLSGWEWIIILFVALLLFGRRLPDIMRGLGSSVKEFKKGMDEVPPAPAPPAIPTGSVARDSAPAAPAPTAPTASTAPPAAPPAQTPPKA